MPWEGKKPTRSWLATVLACEWDQWPRGHCYYPGWSTEKRVRSILRISLIGHMEKLLLKNRSYQENKAPCKTKGEYTTPSNSLNQSKHPGKLCLLCSSWFLPLVTWFSKFLVDFLLRIKLKGGSWEHRRTRISRGKGGEGDTAVLLLNDEIFFFFQESQGTWAGKTQKNPEGLRPSCRKVSPPLICEDSVFMDGKYIKYGL